jgi:pimeloyl-ACP methyl ester carboxylesterase
MGVGAVLLALAALALSSPSLQARDFRYSTVDGHDGVPLNVVDGGARGTPSIVFIHGSGQSYLSWSRQFESTLTDEFHLVAFDLRGHGNSGKPWGPEAYSRACTWADDVAAVIAATGARRPVLVAWSFGGAVAMHYVRCRGIGSLAGIVMVGSRGGLVDVALPSADTPARISQELMKSDDLTSFARGAAMFADLMTAKPPEPERLTLQRTMNLMSPAYARRAMDAPVTDAAGNVIRGNRDLIGTLKLPFHVVLGGDDPFRSTAEMAAAFAAQLPAAHVTVYPSVGHSPFYEEPEAFNRLLSEFRRHAP